MSRDEIIQLLKASVGQEVKIVYASGDVELVSVVNVDGEGFVGELEEHGAMVPHWTRFEDAEAILPAGKMDSGVLFEERRPKDDAPNAEDFDLGDQGQSGG